MSSRFTAHDLLPFLQKPQKYNTAWLEETLEESRAKKRSIWKVLRKEGVELRPTGKKGKSGYWRDSRGRFVSKKDSGYKQAIKARQPRISKTRIRHKGKLKTVETRYGEKFDARWYGPYKIIPPLDIDQLYFCWQQCHHLDKTRIIVTFDYYDIEGELRGNAGTTSSYYFPDEFDKASVDILDRLGKEGNYKQIIDLRGVTIVTRSAGEIINAADNSFKPARKRKKR